MPTRTRSPLTARAAALPLPDPTILARFRPSRTQRQFAQLAVATEAPLRISALCRQLGIARSTYYRWLDDPAFRGWMALQWATALLGDGGRLLSIARLRAETDYRYFKSLLELVFDPRGLGLLATWQQRMLGCSDSRDENRQGGEDQAPEPLFEAGEDPEEEAEREARMASREYHPVFGAKLPAAEQADGPESPAQPAPVQTQENAAVAPPTPVESTTCTPKTLQNSVSAEPAGRCDPAVEEVHSKANETPPYATRLPPPWPNGGRFQY